MGFKIQEPPPIQREGKPAEQLDPKEAKELLGMLTTKDENGEYPWAFDTQDYSTKPRAQSRVLFYRSELVRLKLIEHPKQIRSRTVPAEKVGGAKGAFRYGLCFREASAVNENATGGDSEPSGE